MYVGFKYCAVCDHFGFQVRFLKQYFCGCVCVAGRE